MAGFSPDGVWSGVSPTCVGECILHAFIHSLHTYFA